MKLEFSGVLQGKADGMGMLPNAGFFLCFGLLLVLAPFQHTAGCSHRHLVCCCQRWQILIFRSRGRVVQ